MIVKLSKNIAVSYEKKGYVTNDEVEIVAYGLFSIISKLLYAVICIICGLIFDKVLESCIFYSSFLFIKKYAGGFHAETEFGCFCVSTLSIVISIFVIYLSEMYLILELVIFSLSLIAYILIWLYAPIPSKEKPLNENEYKRYKNISKKRIIISIIMVLLPYAFVNENIGISMAVAAILESILLISGKMKLNMYLV